MGSNATCPWCRLPLPPQATTCPHCGAPVDVRGQVSDSGWHELPPIRDLARIQFGRSDVQVAGTYVPVADCNLAPGEGVYFTHHVLLWRDPTVQVQAMPVGGWKRMFAGLPVIMTQAQGPGHIAFSRDAPGETVAVPLQAGQGVDVREGAFLVATQAVEYGYFQTNVWWSTRSGDDVDYHYPVGQFMDRFVARQQPGLLLLHASGNAFVRTLREGEAMLIKPTALLYKDPSVAMQLHLEYPGGAWSPWGQWANRYLWLTMFGPGRIAVHSAYDKLEDNGGSIYQMSMATQQQW
jgi:uncharacterized protein (AIM24 family)